MTGAGTDIREAVLQLVVFSTAGVSFGADAEQIAAIREHVPDAGEDPSRFLDEVLPSGGALRSSRSAILEVRAGDALHPVAVDRIEEIVEVGIGAIRPLPPLVARFVRDKGVWGVVPRGGKMLVLIDFEKVPAGEM